MLPTPLSWGAPGAYLLGYAVYWDTLAPRITDIGCHSVVRNGPGSPDEGSHGRT